MLELDDEECAAKTESCCSSLRLWHAGHSGFCDPITSASKRFSQSRQMYSKSGISF